MVVGAAGYVETKNVHLVNFYLPWDVVQVSAAYEQPLIERLVVLPPLSVQVEQALRVERSPADEEGQHDGSCESARRGQNILCRYVSVMNVLRDILHLKSA